MCGGRGLPLPLAMLGEIQLTLPIAARPPAPRPGRRAMKLAGLSAKTQEVYLQAVIALVKRYGNRSPDQLTEEEVRRYLLEVRERNARGTFKARHYGIQFFYRNT